MSFSEKRTATNQLLKATVKFGKNASKELSLTYFNGLVYGHISDLRKMKSVSLNADELKELSSLTKGVDRYREMFESYKTRPSTSPQATPPPPSLMMMIPEPYPTTSLMLSPSLMPPPSMLPQPSLMPPPTLIPRPSLMPPPTLIPRPSLMPPQSTPPPPPVMTFQETPASPRVAQQTTDEVPDAVARPLTTEEVIHDQHYHDTRHLDPQRLESSRYVWIPSA